MDKKLTPEQAQAKRDYHKAYNKAYYKKNRKSILASLKKKRCSSEYLAYQKAYYKKNRKKIRAAAKTEYEKNKDKITANYRARYKKYKEAAGGHPWHEKQKKWRTKNKAHKNSLNSAYRARKAEAMLPTTDLKKIKSIYEKCTKVSEKTETEHQVDHIIPLSLGGAHHQDNLRIIPATENQEKKDKIDPSLGGVWADNDLARKQKEE